MELSTNRFARRCSPTPHLLPDSQGLFCGQDNQELLQGTALDGLDLHFGVAAGMKAKGRSPTEQGMAGWEGPLSGFTSTAVAAGPGQ